MKPPSLTKMAADPFFRRLKLAETFVAADAAEGTFKPDDRRDDARLHDTSAWVLENCRGLTRRTVRRHKGYVQFEFEVVAEAEAFRVVTASTPGLILCR